MIIANTYATAPHHLAAAGFGDRAREINVRSVEIALEARAAAADGPAWVAGSLSLMAPGFQSANRLAPAEHAAQLRMQAEWLAEAGADLLAVEMLRDVEWSTAAMDAALSVGLPVWAGFSCVVDERGALVTQGSVAGPMPLEDVLRAVAGRGGSARGHHALGDRGHRPRARMRASRVRGAARGLAEQRHFEPPRWQFRDVVAPGEFGRDGGEMGGGRGEGDRRMLRARAGTRPRGGGAPARLIPPDSPRKRRALRKGPADVAGQARTYINTAKMVIRRSVGESDTGGCFHEHGSVLLVRGRRGFGAVPFMERNYVAPKS